MSHNIPVSKPLSVAVFAIQGKIRFEKGFFKNYCMHILGFLEWEGVFGSLFPCFLCFLGEFCSCMEGDNLLLV